MAKGGQNQTTTQTLDPASQQYLQQFLRPLGMGLANLALGQQVGGAQQGNGGFQQGGAGGGGLSRMRQSAMMNASGGPLGGPLNIDPAQIPQYFPGATPEFMQGVDILRNLDVSAMNDFDRQRQLSAQRAAQMATQQGAFGGSRSAVLESLGQRDINEVEAQTLARLRAGQAQGLLGAGDILRGYNVQQAQNPLFAAQQAMGFASGGLGPYGSVTSQPLHGNPLGGAFGGAATGFGAFGVPGAIGGGLLGLFGAL